MAAFSLSEKSLRAAYRAVEQITATHERILRATVPLYARGDNGVLFLAGSSFILAVQDLKFLITAAHVIRNSRPSPLWISGDGRLHSLRTTFACLHDPSFDVAFAQLNRENEEQLSDYILLSTSDIDVDDMPRADYVYTFMGFPSTMNRVRRRSYTPTVQPFTSHTPLLESDYRAHHFDIDRAIAVYFDLSKAQRGGTGPILQTPSPKGISGGPVWRLGSYSQLSEHINQEKVVGIGVEYRRTPGLLVGRRIGLAIEYIRVHYPGLSAALLQPGGPSSSG